MMKYMGRIFCNMLNYSSCFIFIIMAPFGLQCFFSLLLGNIISHDIISLIVCILMTVLFFFSHLNLVRNGVPSVVTVPIGNRQIVVKTLIIGLVLNVCILTLMNGSIIYISDAGMAARADFAETSNFWVLIIRSVLIAPVFEEFTFRFFMYTNLKRSSHWIMAMLCSSIVFGLYHGTVAHILFATVFGILLVLSYEYTGRIFVPIVLHISYNVMGLLGFSIPFILGSKLLFYALCMIIVTIVIVLIYFMDLKLKDVKYRDIPFLR